MSNDSKDDKTEPATERRRTQAREEGNVARSTDLTAATVLMAACGGMYFVGPSSAQAMTQLLRTALSADARFGITREDAAFLLQSVGLLVASAMLPVMLMTALGSLSVNLMQVGFMWSPEVLTPKFSRINPLSGFGRIFSIGAVVRLGGSLAKILLVASVGYLYLTTRQPEFFALSQQEASVILAVLGRSIVELGFYLALTLICLAILDYGYQYWQHERDLRMTKQEIRDEMKDMDGNPHIRARRREAHRKLVEARELGQVKTADVVITNPTHIAVAVKYDPLTMPAPVVVAKGMGEIAAQIRRLAAEHGVPIIERKPLARALYRDVKVGRAIPVDMYEVFVEILAYVYRLTGRKPPTVL